MSVYTYYNTKTGDLGIISEHEASLSGVHFGASGELVSLIYRMSAVPGGLCGGRVALLAKLVEDTFVFVHVEDTPIRGKTTSTPGLTGG